MNKILMSIGGFGFLFIFRRVLFWLLREGGVDDAIEDGGPLGFLAKFMLRLASALGIDEVNESGFAMLVAGALVVASAMGWIYHLVFEQRGFGPWLNGVIAFSFGSVAVIHWSHVMHRDGGANAVVVALLGSAAGLLALVIIKKIIVDGVGLFSVRGASSGTSRPRNADRVAAATRRR